MFLVALCGAAHADAGCELRVGTSGDYAPFSVATADGAIEGLDADIAQRLGRDLGCTVRFVAFKWPELISTLEGAAVDIVASGVTMRPERALVGRFTRPYAVTGAVVLIRAADEARLRTLTDLNQSGVRIVVNAGGHLERVARSLVPAATLQPMTDNRALPQALRDGSADAVVSDSAEAGSWSADALRVLGPFTHDYKAIILPAGAGDWTTRVDDWLVAREQDGWLARERERWIGTSAALSAASLERESIAALIGLRLGLMPAVAAAKRAANLPIEDRAQEERVLERVTAQAQHAPQRARQVYALLIAMAKAIQHATSASELSASVPVLREAIGRIDEQLVRELDRARPASSGEWQESIDAAITFTAIDPAMRAELVHVLAEGGGSTVARP